MGFLLASMFGARRRVYEFDESGSKTPYYIVSTINNMWLADTGLNEVHYFEAPRADVVRLEDGPRSLSGIDKGRWFVVITDDAPDQDGWMGYKKLYCNSEARARGIREDAERIRQQYEDRQLGAGSTRSVWEQIERSEKAGREADEFIARFDRKVAEDAAKRRGQVMRARGGESS